MKNITLFVFLFVLFSCSKSESEIESAVEIDDYETAILGYWYLVETVDKEDENTWSIIKCPSSDENKIDTFFDADGTFERRDNCGTNRNFGNYSFTNNYLKLGNYMAEVIKLTDNVLVLEYEDEDVWIGGKTEYFIRE